MKKITANLTGAESAQLLYDNDLEAQSKRWTAKNFALNESATVIIDGIEYLFRSKIDANTVSPAASDLASAGNWSLIGALAIRTFADIATANAAITNVTVNGKNQREGRFVFIGAGANVVLYWWTGGTADANLLPYLDAALTKLSFPGLLQLEPRFVRSKNKFNGVVTEGFYLSSAGVATTSATSSYSDYQAVTPGTTETVSGLTYATATGFVVAFYTAAKVFISALSGTANMTHAIPANAAFKRFNTRFTQATPSYGTIQSEVGAAATAYVAYSIKIAADAVEAPQDNAITTAKIADRSVTPEKTSFFLNAINIFDKATMYTADFLLNNGNGTAAAAAGWTYVTIPVDPSKGNVVFNKGAGNLQASDQVMHFFDGSGVRLGYSTLTTAVIPAGTATLRMNISNSLANRVSALNTFMVEYGTVSSSVYAAFGAQNTIQQKYLPVTGSAVQGKKAVWIGDSIVKGTNGYVSFVEKTGALLGLVTINKGDNGATIANTAGASCMSGVQLTYQFDATANLFVLSAGTNDFGNNNVIGTATDSANSNDATVRGSLAKAIKYIKANAPAAKILAFTPIERGTNVANTLGLYLSDYRAAIITECVLQGVPYLDNYYNNLISMPTAYKYLQPDLLHPNDGGYLVMTEKIAPAVSSILLS